MTEYTDADVLGLEVTSLRTTINQLPEYEGRRRSGDFPVVKVNDYVRFPDGACVVITRVEEWASGALHWQGVCVSHVAIERDYGEDEVAEAVRGMVEILEATG